MAATGDRRALRTLQLGFGLLFVLACAAGCGETKHDEAPATPKHEAALPATPTQATPAAPSAKEDTLARIKREGGLKWGSDADGGAPYVFHDETDTTKIVGFEMDLMDAYCKHLGVKPERVQGEWDSLIDSLKSHRCDMVVNGIEINEEHKQVVAFSDPYFIYEQQLTLRADDKNKYKSLADLKGHKIGVLGETEAQHVVERAGFTADQIVKYEDSQTPYQDLEIKRTDAVVQESIIAAHYAWPKADLFNVPQTFNPGQYGFAIRLEDATLVTETNKILATMKANGELAAIYAKWHILNEPQKTIGIVSK